MRITRTCLVPAILLAGVFSPGCAAPMGADRSPTPASPLEPVQPRAAEPTAVPGPALGVPEARSVETDPFVIAGLHAPRPKPKSPKVQGVSLPNSQRDEIVWNASSKSIQGRPIEWLQLGEGSRKVAVLASLHGNETQSLYLVTQLARHLSANPETIAGQTLLIVRTPNPDALHARSAFNARGVDLNRNFPSNNWKVLPKNRSGARVGSEVETRALVKLLQDFQPELVIHVKDTREASLVNAEGDARPKAESLAQQHGWREAHDLGQVTSGSIEHFASTRLKCDALTLLAKRESAPEEAWDNVRPILLSSLDDLVAAPATATTSRRRSGTPAADVKRQALTDDSDDGVFARAKRDAGTGPIPDEGYVELPPSPPRRP